MDIKQIEQRIVKILQVRKPKKVIVSFSGGKDSTLLLEAILRSIKDYESV